MAQFNSKVAQPHYNVWCYDDGYGDNKCVTGEKHFIIPSNYTDWRHLQRDELNNKERNALDYVSVEFNGGKFLVGESAMRQDSKNSWFGGENKHEDRGFPILLNACLGLMADLPSEKVDCLVMGLPVQSDENGSRHSLLTSRVVGQHQMRVTLGDGSEFVREVVVENLIVKKQPFGSLCDIMLDDEGNIIEKDVAKGFNVVVDIGSRTLNVYTLDNLEPISDLCFQTNDGMYTSYMGVGNFVKNKIGYEIPTGKLPLYINNKFVKGIDLTPVIQKSFEILSYEIKKVIETRFINSWAFVDRIIFTGGGSELLKHWLSSMFIKKSVIFMDRFANARGLRKYGVRHIAKMKPKGQEISIKVGSSHVKQY
jgi:plasmid segregation protein ParM